MTAVAFLGQGHMGVPMASRLLAAGHQTTVWNRTGERCVAAAAHGARVAGTASDAVRGADVVITMLRDAAAVGAVLFEDQKAADALTPGAVLLEMSTIGPDAVRSLRDRLPAQVALIDAPVVGSVPQATAGQLRILAGGAEADLARVADVLAALGSVERMGDLGAGAGAKLVANLVTITAFALVGESLALGDRVGLSIDQTLELLARSAIGDFVTRIRGRFGTDPAPTTQFGLGLAEKDLALALAAGADPAGIVGAAHRGFLHAATAGLSGNDISAVVASMRSRAHTLATTETRGQ